MDILSTLGRLSDADRHWIIENLPAQAKSQLLSVSPPGHSLSASDPMQPSLPTDVSGAPDSSKRNYEDASQTLAAADSGLLADVLKAEPAWLTAALLRSREWTWRSEVMGALPSGLRTEVARIADSDLTFTPHLTTTVVNLVTARLNGQVAPRTVSRFEALVEKLAATRSKRRWSINL